MTQKNILLVVFILIFSFSLFSPFYFSFSVGFSLSFLLKVKLYFNWFFIIFFLMSMIHNFEAKFLSKHNLWQYKTFNWFRRCAAKKWTNCKRWILKACKMFKIATDWKKRISGKNVQNRILCNFIENSKSHWIWYYARNGSFVTAHEKCILFIGSASRFAPHCYFWWQLT